MRRRGFFAGCALALGCSDEDAMRGSRRTGGRFNQQVAAAVRVRNCVVVAEGDSLTTNNNSLSWFTQMPQPQGMQKYNVAGGGRTVANMAIAGNISARITSKYNPAVPCVVSVWGGVNDFNTGRIAADVFNDYMVIRDTCVAAGFIFWAWYVMESGALNASEDAERVTFNDLLASNSSAFRELIDPRQVAPEPYNQPYWVGGGDVTHLSTTGQALLLPQVNAAFARSVP